MQMKPFAFAFVRMKTPYPDECINRRRIVCVTETKTQNTKSTCCTVVRTSKLWATR